MITQSAFIELRESFSSDRDLVDIQGWLKPIEQQALHGLSALLEGPILEVGSWIGRSTCCLARGLLLRRHRAQNDQVTSVELNPDESFFRKNGEDEVEFWCPGDTEMRGKTTTEIYEAIVRPAISFPGGIVGKLKETLIEHKVDHLVRIVTGDVTDVLPVESYGLIFSDISHTPFEIGIMVKALEPVLRPGVILACHDTTPQNRTALESLLNYEWTEMCGSLHIGLIGDI